MPRAVNLFWDNSNIFIGARTTVGGRGRGCTGGVRIDFDHLVQLAVAGRNLQSAFCVGSVPPPGDRVLGHLRQRGVELELYERGGRTGTEQAIDQALQVHLLRLNYDNSEPQIVTVLTGDGAGYAAGVGFRADLERLHRAGWYIELLSWERCCSRPFREWVEDIGVFVPLDEWIDSIVFEEGVSRTKPLNLARRKKMA